MLSGWVSGTCGTSLVGSALLVVHVLMRGAAMHLLCMLCLQGEGRGDKAANTQPNQAAAEERAPDTRCSSTTDASSSSTGSAGRLVGACPLMARLHAPHGQRQVLCC